MVSKETLRRGNLNIGLMVCVFLKFVNQILFSLAGTNECAAAQLSDKDATGCMLGIVAGMDADPSKPGT